MKDSEAKLTEVYEYLKASLQGDLIREARLMKVYEYLKASLQGDEVILSNALTSEERTYLLAIVRQHLSYYEMLVGLPNATESSKTGYQFIKSLIRKLQ